MMATAAETAITSANPRRLRLEPAQVILAWLLALEVVVFSVIGTNFLSVANAFEVLRLSVEIGLLALALTPVITSGGIDLSVGSLMGLSAVIFGKLWRDGGLPISAAVMLTLLVGALAGTLNGILITRGRIPPLIVTLGAFSLYRGLAEGLTGGVDNFTDFPERFLFLGQGYSVGGVPTQVPIFVVVALGFWLLLHRTTMGRGIVAIGFSPEGARYAGLPVARIVGSVYLLSGLVASLAAVIYVAHLGQAKADAGTGYELAAITAVVLGGTSIFGGRGSVPGTVLGLFAIAVLQNGLRLADLPAELAGVLTGALLLVAIGLDRQPSPFRLAPRADSSLEVMNVKNSQVAVICAAILAGAAINAISNFALVKSLRNEQPGRDTLAPAARRSPDHRGNDAQEQGKRVLHRVSQGGRGSGPRAWYQADLGRTDRSRPGETERSDRHLDHTRSGRDRRCGRESRGDLVGIAQGSRARNQGTDVGRGCRPGRAGVLCEPGDARGDWSDADGQRGANPGRQRVVRDHHRIAHRGQHDRLAKDHRGAPGGEVPTDQDGGLAAVRRPSQKSV